MEYILTCCSKPFFELKTHDVRVVEGVLSPLICSGCKMTRSQYAAKALEEGRANYKYNRAYEDAMPDNFDNLSPEDRVDLLLDTACGCEFTLDKIPDTIAEKCIQEHRKEGKCIVVTRSEFVAYTKAGGKVTDLPYYINHSYTQRGDARYVMICLM